MSGRRQLVVLSGLGLTEASWGMVLLRASAPRLQSVAREPVDRRTIDAARVLGVRHLVQGLITVGRPTPLTLRTGAGVDALHAVSMLVAAAAGVGPRRLTSTSAAVAGGFAVVGASESRRRPPGR